MNRLGQRGPTELEWDMAAYQRRAEAFGCAAVVIDGHDVAQIDAALAAARDAARPTATKDLDLSQAAVLAGLLRETT